MVMTDKEKFLSQLGGDKEFEVVRADDLKLLRAQAQSAEALMTAISIISLRCKSELEVRREGGDLIWMIIKDIRS